MSEQLTRSELVDLYGETAVRHSERFRRVSNGYPHVVAQAYGGDLDGAAADSDEQVAANVAAYERGHDIEPRDWVAIGAEERDDASADYDLEEEGF